MSPSVRNGITSLSASGLLLPPSLGDPLPLLRGDRWAGALVVTTASAVEPFLPAKFRDLGFSGPTAPQVHARVVCLSVCLSPSSSGRGESSENLGSMNHNSPLLSSPPVQKTVAPELIPGASVDVLLDVRFILPVSALTFLLLRV